MIGAHENQVTMTQTFNDGLMEISRTTDDSEGNSEQTTLRFRSLGSSGCFEVHEVSDSEVTLTITGAWEIAGIVDGLKRILK